MRSSICTLSLLASAVAAANSTCKDDWVCVDEVRVGDRIKLRARNLQEFPLTFTVRVNTRSYAVSGSKTITRTLDAGASETVMELVPRDDYRSSSYQLNLEWTVGDQHANHDDSYRYAFPYEKGRSYRILQGYGSRFSHRGREEFAIDFDMPVGTPVHASRSGIVARVIEKHDKGCWEDGCGKFANYIVVLHDDGTTGEYYHLQKNGALVDAGDTVSRGQRIGFSGNTGHTTMPHLHFAVYRATSWGNTQSIPVTFESADGIVHKPRRGGRHQAAY